MWFPLFPLPNTVLLSGEVLQLYVFEERYKQLLNDIRSAEANNIQAFGIVRITKSSKESSQPLCARIAGVGTLAHLQLVQSHEDGSSSLMVQGGQRFRILALDDSRPYLRAQLELWPVPPSCQQAHELALQLLGGVMRALPEQAHAIALKAPHDPLMLCSYLADWISLPTTAKEQLLCADDLLARLLLLRQLLPAEASRTLGMLN